MTWIVFRKPLCLCRMLDLRLRSSLKTENSLTHPPQPAQTVIPSKLSTLTHRLRLRLLKLKRSLSKRTNRTRSLKPSLLGRRTVSMSILLMFSSSRLMRQRLLPSKSERNGNSELQHKKFWLILKPLFLERILLLLKMARLHTQFN